MDSSLVIPFTLWSCSKPSFRISSMCVTPNLEKLVTGSHDGHLCMWDLNIKKKKLNPKIILIGHENPITCMVSTNKFLISTCEGGEMCRWNIEDGYCEKAKNLLCVHRNVQLFKQSVYGDELLFTCGDYSSIFIYQSVTLQRLCSLYCEADFDWISNFHIARSQNDQSIIVSSITAKGCVNSWIIEDGKKDSQCAIHTINLPVENVVDLKYDSSKTMILIVTVNYWCLFDTQLFNCIHKVSCDNGERLLGGNFCNSNVVIWTNSGKFYLYAEKDNKQQVIAKLQDESSKFSLFKPAMIVIESKENENYFFKGDSNNKIRIWTIDKLNKESDFSIVMPLLSTSLSEKWIAETNGFFDSFITFSTATCCTYALELDKFFIGCLNGKIICIPAMQAIMSFYYCSAIEKPCYDFLSGHKGKINCLLYPHAKYKHYNEAYLVSGSKDFSVCLWDIFKLELLHRFCDQGGEILKLIIPPENCNFHVRHSICSVSSDNSVAILNLVKKRCIILASKHSFPVVSVNWRPLDDFLIIECFDGTVYVWETETGFLDRVLHGVVAQEVLYACNENSFYQTTAVNYYICERVIKNSMERKVFEVHNNIEMTDHPITLCGFHTNEKWESPIFLCNVDYLITKIISDPDKQDGDFSKKIYFLTKILSPEFLRKPSSMLFEKIMHKTEAIPEKVESKENHGDSDNCNETEKKDVNGCLPALRESIQQQLLQFLLSSLHVWELDSSLDEILVSNLGLIKPDAPLSLGVVSTARICSLFLPTEKKTHGPSPSLLAAICIAMTALTKALKIIGFLNPEGNLPEQRDALKELYGFYEGICLNSNKEMVVVPRLRIEVLAKAWQSKCLPLRNIVRKLLPSHLETLAQQEHADLLKSWCEYLPNIKATDKFDNLDLEAIALVLFGTVGTDLKFKNYLPSCQENYAHQTSSSLMHLLLLQGEEKHFMSNLQTLAIDFIGRGYIVWEPYLKIENIFPVLFRMCRNMLKFRFQCNTLIPESLDKSLTAYEALKAIAIARTSAFIKCLTIEIDRVRTGPRPQSKGTDIFSMEDLKPEILAIVVFLLEETPYIMLLYLNEIISILVYCIDSSHLKRDNLVSLIPVMKKFRQIHHCVAGQRIAVGSGTGSISVHDLKTGKTLSVSAHRDSISAIKFSQDGKFLVSYSCYENRISFWQVLTGIFGLGQAQVRWVKSYQTYRIQDEEIRNHFQIAELTWEGNKSVVLSLCDGTETVFNC